jgi:hypothetical protein
MDTKKYDKKPEPIEIVETATNSMVKYAALVLLPNGDRYPAAYDMNTPKEAEEEALAWKKMMGV